MKNGIRICSILILLALLPSPSAADDIKLRNGQRYDGVTILRRDDKTVEIQTRFGRAKIPLPSIESINNAAVWPTPSPVPGVTPVAAAPAETRLPQSTPEPAKSDSPAAEESVSPAADETPAPTPLLVWPRYQPRWNMEVLLFGIALFFALWVLTLSRVQRDLFERRADPRLWTNVAIILPILGFLIYLAVTTFNDRRKRATNQPLTPNESIAGRERNRVKTLRARSGFEFLDEDRKAVLVKNEGEVSGIENAQEVLEEALLERASDVHIEPGEAEYRVRFRVDGIMQPRMNFDRPDGQRIVSALKTLAQIDVAEKRKAQDGRFRVRAGGSDVDFRVATANSIFGEKLVIRILDRHAGLLGLSDLGMKTEMLEQLARVIHSRNGMILATGPTGSGKTSTLYAALSQLDAARLNIMTIEDPVEYELSGATQLPVNVKAGVTYESGLRSLLRQDPDVIFVGEMRDIEAAQIALRAALTGHLVFSSLHTRDAIGTILRLVEMGVERHVLASSLLVLLAQRLVRVLCPACREAAPCLGGELAEINLELPAGETIYRAKGCAECGNAGYVGRTGIFEMVVFDEALRQAVSSGANEDELLQHARNAGYHSYREDGAEKVLLGITSVEEVLQAS
ncbi:MAG: ral secretion pathway protein [Chthoniobacter sp.]|nr:ral secretion pathway protein [Chthoniobacter sp.]